MKRFNKLLCFMLVFMTVMIAFCSVGFAATIGQPLTSPEAGWQRIDDSNTSFIYKGTWDGGPCTSPWYNYTYHDSSIAGSSVTFKFYGTKLRIITSSADNYSKNVTVSIDGNSATTSFNSGTLKFQWIAYENISLPNGAHTVTITNNVSNKIGFDAIDIDDTGYLIDYYAPTNLEATGGNAKVYLSWDAVEGASGYNIYRSTASGTAYTKIGSNTTSSAITYEDEPLTNGTTYYYVVTAIVNGVESGYSNEASATPTAPVVTGNSAILEITMVTGEIKEYDLAAAELQSFLSWYDGRSNGTDKAYYMIPKKNNIKPFLSRKDYIAFDKISSFEVNEYTE